MIIWPATADRLNRERTLVAVNWLERSFAKVAMYKETGKYERPCSMLVMAC